MNVTNGIDNLSRVSGTQPAAAEVPARNAIATPEAGLSQDLAQLSSIGTQVAQSASASDVRLDKVAAIQSALQSGTYQVPASDVAQKIVDSMIENGR